MLSRCSGKRHCSNQAPLHRSITSRARLAHSESRNASSASRSCLDIDLNAFCERCASPRCHRIASVFGPRGSHERRVMASGAAGRCKQLCAGLHCGIIETTARRHAERTLVLNDVRENLVRDFRFSAARRVETFDLRICAVLRGPQIATASAHASSACDRLRVLCSHPCGRDARVRGPSRCQPSTVGCQPQLELNAFGSTNSSPRETYRTV